MSAYLCPVLRQYFFQNNAALAGGQLFSYTAGTTIPQATYTDSTGATPNTNPIILDSQGSAEVWIGSGSYKFVLEDSQGNVIFTVDDVTAQSNGSNIGSQNTFTVADNESAYQDVTGMVIDHTKNQCVTIEYTIIRTDGTTWRREHGFLYLTYDSENGWNLTRETQPSGADALNMGASSLSVTAGGQIQYKSDSMGGTYQGQMTWQIDTAFPAEGI